MPNWPKIIVLLVALNRTLCLENNYVLKIAISGDWIFNWPKIIVLLAAQNRKLCLENSYVLNSYVWRIIRYLIGPK